MAFKNSRASRTQQQVAVYFNRDKASLLGPRTLRKFWNSGNACRFLIGQQQSKWLLSARPKTRLWIASKQNPATAWPTQWYRITAYLLSEQGPWRWCSRAKEPCYPRSFGSHWKPSDRPRHGSKFQEHISLSSSKFETNPFTFSAPLTGMVADFITSKQQQEKQILAHQRSLNSSQALRLATGSKLDQLPDLLSQVKSVHSFEASQCQNRYRGRSKLVHKICGVRLIERMRKSVMLACSAAWRECRSTPHVTAPWQTTP